MNQMYPERQSEEPVAPPGPIFDKERVKRIKVAVFALSFLVVILLILSLWFYARLNGCQNAYERGFNECVDQVNSIYEENPDSMPYLPFELNVTADANIGMIT